MPLLTLTLDGSYIWAWFKITWIEIQVTCARAQGSDSSGMTRVRTLAGVPGTPSPADRKPVHKPTELSRIKPGNQVKETIWLTILAQRWAIIQAPLMQLPAFEHQRQTCLSFNLYWARVQVSSVSNCIPHILPQLFHAPTRHMFPELQLHILLHSSGNWHLQPWSYLWSYKTIKQHKYYGRVSLQHGAI